MTNISRAKKAKTFDNFFKNADLSDLTGDRKWSCFIDAVTKCEGTYPELDEDTALNLLDCEILIAGYIGKAGTSFICDVKREELYERMNVKFVDSGRALFDFSKEDGFLRKEITDVFDGEEISIIIPVLEGGLYKALFELWKIGGKGFTIDYESVPTKQVTIEACEAFDLDPWQLLSKECYLVATKNAGRVKRKLKTKDIPCEMIGYITDDKDKLICHRENVSRLNRPGSDELLKILKSELPED